MLSKSGFFAEPALSERSESNRLGMTTELMKKIGLTGSIATGKSTVIWMFQEMGATIINADEIAHKLLEPETVVWKLLFERYGARIMQRGT